jgi:ketosteroid isomerase-like protein
VTDATRVVSRFLVLQRAMYAGGDLGALEDMLADDIVWHVPGTSPIAGDHTGRQGVLDYFRRRRELAGGEITITARGALSDDEVLVQLADGEATINGEHHSWRTVGVYRVEGERIKEAWLVPFDLDAFDRAWATP